MLLAASVLLIGGYTLLYAGVRGIEWQHPWNILIGNTPRPAGSVTASGTPVQTASPAGGAPQGLPPVPAPGIPGPPAGRVKPV